MEVLMIVVATAAGAIFGFMWRYFLDKDLIEDAYYEWDKIYSEERKRRDEREKRLYAEVTRLHKENAMLKHNKVESRQTVPQESNKWLDMLENVNDPNWETVDFRKEW